MKSIQTKTFPIPATAEEAEKIIKKVLRIVYPNGEGIKNKRTLIHVLKKKLMNGRLEIPEGWQDLQQKKNETVDQESKNNAEKIRIVYPNEGIKNKRTLIHALKKKLMNGRLEMPEGWQDLQKKKKETADHNQESQKIADGVSFQKAKEEFARLPENEQKKYLDAARRTANGIALQDSTALCVAIQLAAKERKEG